MKHKYEIRGRVKISGEWYEIKGLYGAIIYIEPTNWIPIANLEQLIEAYEPPKKEEVYEWVDCNTPMFHLGDGLSLEATSQIVRDTNEFLTEKYGDPTIRTYQGEKAEEFGLTDESSVLIWEMEQWEMYRFRGIGKDDIWRKLPAAPKGGE